MVSGLKLWMTWSVIGIQELEVGGAGLRGGRLGEDVDDVTWSMRGGKLEVEMVKQKRSRSGRGS